MTIMEAERRQASRTVEPDRAHVAEHPLHILVVGGQSDSLTILRGSLIQAMIARGHRVSTAAGQPEPHVLGTLAGWGAAYHEIPMERAGLNPLNDARTVAALVRLMRRLKPDVVLGYQAKPLNYAMIAGALAGVPRRIGLVTGLGYAFADGEEPGRKLARRLSEAVYWLGLRCADGVIFQNEEDRALFRERGLTPRRTPTIRVFGSGVDLARFAPAPEPSGPPSFVMIARLLKDKGVYDYVEAARLVKDRIPSARFILVGPYDPNPAGIRPAEIEEWEAEGLISYAGAAADVRPYLSDAHVVVHPTRYREGVPRILLEAMAVGRPIITTNTPGCRDAVVHDKNGLLVASGAPRLLAEAMLALGRDANRRRAMQDSGRARACALFDVDQVSRVLIDFLEGSDV